MVQADGGRERIAFFGGSFDPPHEGHLAIARAAMSALALDRVLFAPVGAQPLKPEGSTAPFHDRVAMTRLAVEQVPGFVVSLVDAPRDSGGPNYTLETLLQLSKELAPALLFCLMGSDSFFGLRHWHRGAEVPFAAPLIVASRPGQPVDDLMSALPDGLAIRPAAPGSTATLAASSASSLRIFTVQDKAGRQAPLYLLTGLEFDVSATQVRGQIQRQRLAGNAAPTMVSAAVMDYIRGHGLYR